MIVQPVAGSEHTVGTDVSVVMAIQDSLGNNVTSYSAGGQLNFEASGDVLGTFLNKPTTNPLPVTFSGPTATAIFRDFLAQTVTLTLTDSSTGLSMPPSVAVDLIPGSF